MSLEKNVCYSMFPQIIGLYEFNQKEKLKKDILEVIEHYKNSEFENFDSHNLFHYFNKQGQNLFKNDLIDLSYFKNFLLESVNTYADENLYDVKECKGFVITDCWINVGGEGSFQSAHNHANSFFSGTYYLSYNPKYHSRLSFRNPNNASNFLSSPYLSLPRRDVYNHPCNDFYECDIYDEGDLVLWQSGLHHAYSYCLGNGNDEGETEFDPGYHGRISISMNFMPKYLNHGPYSVTIES